MSAVESPVARGVGAGPFEVLQASVFPGNRLESAILLLMAVAGPIMFFLVGLALAFPGIVLMAISVIPTAALEAVIAFRNRHLWPAQEVLGWISWEASEDWRETVGGRFPSNLRQVDQWLARHPEGTGSAAPRARILLLSGRAAEARREIAGLPTDTAPQRNRRADLEFAADALEGVTLDTTAADLATRADPDSPPASVAAHLAYRAALKAVTEGGNGVAQLSGSRPLIGALPPALGRRLWLDRMRYAVCSAVGAVWLWACLIVALGTAGGVVWF